jgi:PAS domain S-box-containing protein
VAQPSAPEWDRREIVRRAAPFAGVFLLAFATLPLTGEVNAEEVIAAALTALVGVSILVVPWPRLPHWTITVPPLLGLVIVALLRHGEGGASSAFGMLVLAPVLWLALYGTRRELIIVIVGVGLMFALPIVAFGAPEYPESEWRRATLFAAISVFVGFVAQGLVQQVRARVAEAERGARAQAESEARLRAVMDAAAEGIVAVDRDGHATFVNPAAARMFGYAAREIVGRQLHELVHHTRADGSAYPLEECPTALTVRTGQPSAVDDEVYWRRDGTSFAVEYHSMPLRIDGAITGAVLTFTDISERLAVEKMKSEFISVVSHELRTPLTSIRGALGLMEGGVLGDTSEDARRMLSIATSNADRLVRLINEILDIERIEAGTAPTEMRSCELEGLMEQVRDLMASSASEAEVNLVLEPVEARLFVDPDRIIQTLVNLVDNAIKFSPPGTTVRVSAELVGGDDAAGSVRIRVRDQGPGIPPEERETIFERFTQLESTDSRGKGGSGLGLAIAQGIVEQHAGRITVEANEDGGSTFVVELPLRPDDRNQEVGERGDGQLGVLVVEDDADLASVLVSRFERQGLSARRCGSVPAAREALAEKSVELIVLDLALPDEDGQALIDWLREQGRLEENEILIYTARDLSVAERAELRAVADVVTKSRVSPDEFEHRALDALDRARASRDLRARRGQKTV